MDFDLERAQTSEHCYKDPIKSLEGRMSFSALALKAALNQFKVYMTELTSLITSFKRISDWSRMAGD